jgi:hypothetical protein
VHRPEAVVLTQYLGLLRRGELGVSRAGRSEAAEKSESKKGGMQLRYVTSCHVKFPASRLSKKSLKRLTARASPIQGTRSHSVQVTGRVAASAHRASNKTSAAATSLLQQPALKTYIK